MCLILLAFRAHPQMDVLLAGNRDELKRRASAPPQLWGKNPRIWAGKDLEAGGTWMGRNDGGLMAALTNRRSERPEPAEPLSRGEIVVGLLGHRSASAAAGWLQKLPVERYRPFSLLFGSSERFYFFSSEGGGHPQPLQPGFYALSNSTLDDTSWPKVERCHLFFREHRHLGWEELLEHLKSFLGDATPPDDLASGDIAMEIHGAFGAVFIRHPEYGTVSASIFTAGGAAGDRYYFAEGEQLGADPKSAFRPIPLQPVP